MIESKIYAQISDFVNTNHKRKVHAYALPPYQEEIMATLAFC